MTIHSIIAYEKPGMKKRPQRCRPETRCKQYKYRIFFHKVSRDLSGITSYSRRGMLLPSFLFFVYVSWARPKELPEIDKKVRMLALLRIFQYLGRNFFWYRPKPLIFIFGLSIINLDCIGHESKCTFRIDVYFPFNI